MKRLFFDPFSQRVLIHTDPSIYDVEGGLGANGEHFSHPSHMCHIPAYDVIENTSRDIRQTSSSLCTSWQERSEPGLLQCHWDEQKAAETVEHSGDSALRAMWWGSGTARVSRAGGCLPWRPTNTIQHDPWLENQLGVLAHSDPTDAIWQLGNVKPQWPAISSRLCEKRNMPREKLWWTDCLH